MVSTFVQDVTDIVKNDTRAVVVLSGIRQFSFRFAKEISEERVIDIGIMEQNAVGIAAGLSSKGMIPFLHTWTPFLIERAFDQLRLFAMQGSYGNFFGAGGSYELADFGDSHYCPEAIPILKQIKKMEIIVPGTKQELSLLLRTTYADSHPTYYSLSGIENSRSFDVEFGKANIIKQGSKGTVIIVGPMLHFMDKYIDRLDANVLYYTTVAPFDKKTLLDIDIHNRVIICEPYNGSAVLCDVVETLSDNINITMLSMNDRMECKLGTFEQNYANFNLDDCYIENTLRDFFYD